MLALESKVIIFLDRYKFALELGQNWEKISPNEFLHLVQNLTAQCLGWFLFPEISDFGVKITGFQKTYPIFQAP